MQLIDRPTIDQMDRFHRVNFIHSLTGFHSPFLIGTKDVYENLAVFSGIVHLGSYPPLLGIKCRPLGHESHTIKNLSKTGFATINFVTKSMYKQAHFTSARLSVEKSEFKHFGFTPLYMNDFPAPVVEESPIKIQVKLAEMIPIETNNTQLAVVEVLRVFLDQDRVQENGFIDLGPSEIMAVQGLYRYHESSLISEEEYVRRE